MWRLTFDHTFQIVTAAGGFGTFIWTVYTWRDKAQQDLASQKSDAERDRKTRQIEATRPFLDRQLMLYTEACQMVGRIASATDPNIIRSTIESFWSLYYGELAMVENPEVEAAMVAIKNLLDPADGRQLYLEDKAALQKLALELAHTCRRSLDRSWGIHAWAEPDDAAR